MKSRLFLKPFVVTISNPVNTAIKTATVQAVAVFVIFLIKLRLSNL